MTPQEQQMIESLFQRLAQAAAHAGPRDPQAEALIQQQMQRLPGAAYSMAQTLLVQERALREAEARLGGSGSFLPPSGGGPAYRATPPYAAGPPPRQFGGGGGVGSFLAGAGQMALGIGGGILVADAAMSLAHGLFGGGDDDAREQYEDDGGFDQQDDDASGLDDSGDFDNGSSDW